MLHIGLDLTEQIDKNENPPFKAAIGNSSAQEVY